MRKRILAAVILVPLLLTILLAAPKILTSLLVGVLCAIAAYELLRGTSLVRHFRMVIYSVVVAFAVPLWCHFGKDALWGHFLLLTYFCALFAEMMFSHIKIRFEKICICLCAGLLIPYMLSSLVRLINMDHGRAYIMIPVIVAFLADSGAYFIGIRFGSHKLAPVISPNKSVEGVLGGVAFSILSMLIYMVILQFGFQFQVNYGLAILYALLGSAASVFGDLCLSVVKRQTGIKDYGNLIPGHGGVMDRFDSMLIVGPLMEILILLIPVVVKA